ncbi:PKD domain-containing protein [Fluviicola chungangensis]|uniref:PKD domain-containing protein n=1 Tax=Fluviicola chungangensis TaxID=2597671 RepID=A0A556MRF4_9FLAO|nr:PKD domain-containing protein [Fluviicola chungangensis]TSJ42511.1 PKD domain-containing protein [Fluviicola chungangensis]
MRKNYKNGSKSLIKAFGQLTVFIALFGFNGWSQSDGCTGVPSLTVGASCSTTNFSLPGSFSNGGLVVSSCNVTDRDDGWYSFTATSPMTQITATATLESLVVAVWTSCAGGSQVGCGNASSGGSVTVTVPTTSGTTYYIQLHRQSGNGTASMNGTICLTALTPPANDNCNTATTLTQSSSCVTTNGTVAGATNSGIASCTGTADDDVWYSFTATNTTAIITRTTTGSWDSGIEIFASTGAAPGSCIGASLGCQDAESNFTVNGLTVGMHYYVRVYYWYTGGIASGDFTICITEPPALPSGSIVMPASGSTTACSGNFYDSGGLADYANSESRVFTICPSTAGAKLKLVFSAFQTEGVDYLEVFDGNSVAAPSLGTFSGSTSPGTIQATPSNASGCLTFRFTSDGSVVYPGWVAAISCVIPCQSITSNWVSSNEAPMGDGVIRICQGQSINLVGSGTFGTSGTGATYSWSMGNGVSVSGANINYTYPAVGSYLANLTITDPNGCTNTNYINRNIQVSTTPTIATSATPATLCTNQTSALSANVTMTPYTVNCTPPVSGTTFLPDGSGASYSTSITTNCYSPSATVTTATDITNICLNMEHSYSGDLSMQIICPNGQSVSLITYPSGTGSANLGTPWATSTVDGSSTTTTPGVGANYCFATGGTAWATGYASGGTFVSGNGPGTYTDTYMPAGTYAPMQSFAGLVGCPLNGSWTIQVTDNLASDNGYIFNWDINFNAALLSASSFTPTIVSQGWVAAPTLSSTGSTTANVTPTNQGTPCFTYSVTDNFGCTYTQPQCITVNCGTSLPIGLVSFEATAVNNHSVRLNWETSSEQNNDYFVVERSLNGEDGWKQVAVVDGAGNSETPKYYADADDMPLSGVSYYRLKQVDFNGQERVHEMESVYIDVAGMSDLVIFPNPATDLVTLKGDIVSLSTFKLLNSVGQDVRMNVTSYKQGDGSLVLDISPLRAGVYMIKNGSRVYSLVKQ